LVTGKYAKLRCFKNMPSRYAHNNKAWVTMTIFLDVLKEFDARMGSAGRKVILFIDRCAAHPLNTPFLRNVKVVFLTANCTSMLQPLDLGIINCVKSKQESTCAENYCCITEKATAEAECATGSPSCGNSMKFCDFRHYRTLLQ
jgi:hypothetical protein